MTFRGISCRTITLLTFPCNFLIVSLVEYFTKFRLFILGFLKLAFITPLRGPLLPAPNLDSLCLIFCPFLPTVLHALSPISQLPSAITNCKEARLGEAFPFKFFSCNSPSLWLLSIKLDVEGDKKNQWKHMCLYRLIFIYNSVCV